MHRHWFRFALSCLIFVATAWASASENATTGQVSTVSSTGKVDAVANVEPEARSNWSGFLRAASTNTNTTVVATLLYETHSGIKKYDLYTAADPVLTEKIRELAEGRAKVVLHGVLRADGNGIVVDACRELPKKDKHLVRDRGLPP